MATADEYDEFSLLQENAEDAGLRWAGPPAVARHFVDVGAGRRVSALVWGDDPENNVDASNPKPAQTIINPNIKESIINPDTNELPPTHLGWNSRLNGPVDNPRSACMSCHSTAPQADDLRS